MKTILLINGGNKKIVLERAKIIIRLLNLNIRDTINIAKAYNYVTLEDYLIQSIISQLPHKHSIQNKYDCVNNKKYIFFISPDHNQVTPYSSELINYIHFPSKYALNLTLEAKKKKLITDHMDVIDLLGKMIYKKDLKIKGLIY